MKDSDSRILFYDHIKGLLLLIVCLFHTNNSWYGYLGFMFNMPAFFFISGLLFDVNKCSSVSEYILKKTKSLLIPYLGLSFFFLFFTPLLYNPIGYENGTIGFIKSSALEIIQGYSGPYTIPLWFVYVLYFVSISFDAVYRLIKNKGFIGVFLICCFLLSWWISIHSFELPFHLGACTIAFFFYGIGYFSKIMVLQLRSSKVSLLAIYTAVLFLVYYIGYSMNGHVDLRTCSLGNDVIGFLMGTIGGIGFIMSVVCLYDRLFSFSFITNVLTMISKNALVILTVHYWALMCLLWIFEFKRPSGYLMCAIIAEIVSICIFAFVSDCWLRPLVGKR